ncbi:sigma-54-dependent Fis family transcriptional regulator [Candidatus Sumerlaeota bacterium]|nr:sigma-54-dependent Fis family transcriptional regulator [Candidatus Sumerlaeota bacterium]
MKARVLVVDDELGMQVALREVLQRLGHEARIAPDAMTALSLLESESFDLVLSDVRMPEMSGLELLGRIRPRRPDLPVLIMTAYGTIEDAVDAMKSGAADYLLKPFSSETLEEIVCEQLRRRRQADENVETLDADDEIGGALSSGNPIAASPRVLQVLAMAAEVADSKATILIQGESGTGKEVVARYIHLRSGRSARPFVALNCAALPEGLLESELFGHEKGAFTGAVLARKGKFELANHGTLLLDEVSEMPLSLQAKLLRVLQEREIDPLGAQRSVPLDVRVIATTNRDLTAHVEEGSFREDLFYRLQVIVIDVPPLRERREDILPLAEYFVRRHCRMNRRPRKRLSASMRRHLLDHAWRGNVRELENFLERAVLLCKDEEIAPEKLFLDPVRRVPVVASIPQEEVVGESWAAAARPDPDSPERLAAPNATCSRQAGGAELIAPGEQVTLEEMERRLILRTLDQVGGNRTRAADLLGISVRTIRNKLNQYDAAEEEASAACADVVNA